MADKKKVFTIAINGITEAIDGVKSLNSELKDLVKNINSIKDTNINIGTTGNSKKRVTSKQYETPVDEAVRLKEKNAGDILKNEQLLTDEYRQQYQIQQEILRQRKEEQRLQKEIASGARDENGNYTNTIAGLRAQLKEMTSILNTTELTSEEFAKYQEEVGKVNQQLKDLESAHGDFRRNVGNYPSGTKELVALFKEYTESIQTAEGKLKSLKATMSGMDAGSEAYKDAEAELNRLQQEIDETKNAQKELGAEMDKKLKVDVGGEVRYYDNTRQAVKELNMELQKMYMENKVDTKQWNDTIEALGKVRTAMKNTAGEVESYIGASKGLEDTLTVMQGMTGIASVGTGLMGLFGGENKDLDESLRKFMSLTLVINGLTNIIKQAKDESDVFGVNLKKVWNSLGEIDGIKKFDKFLSKMGDRLDFTATQAIALSKNFQNMFDLVEKSGVSLDRALSTDKNITEIQKLEEPLHKLAREFEALKAKAPEAAKALMDSLQGGFPISEMDINDVRELNWELNELVDSGQVTQESIQGIRQKLWEFEETYDKLEMVLSDNPMEAFNEELEVAGKGYVRIGKLLSKLGVPLAKQAKLFKNAGVAVTAFSKAITVGIKSILRATIILAALQLIMELVTKAMEGVGKLADWATGKVEDFSDGFDDLANRAELAKRKLQDFNNEQQRLENTGAQNHLTTLRKQFEAAAEAFRKAKDELLAFTGAQNSLYENGEKPKELDFSKDYTDTTYFGFASSGKNLEEFRDKWNLLVKAIEQGVDEVNAKFEGDTDNPFTARFWKALWYTAGDAQSDFVSMGRALLDDLQVKINKIDWDNPEQATKDFRKLMDDELYSSALAHIDEIVQDDKYKARLKSLIDYTKEMMTELENSKNQVEQLSYQQTLQIEDNYAAAVKSAYERARKQRQIAMERELKEAEGNERLKASIRAKYATQEAEAVRQRNQQLQQNVLDREANLISAMKDGMEKQIAQLENQRKAAILAARNDETKGAKDIAAINANYDAQLLKIKLQYIRESTKLTRDRIRTIEDLENNFYKDTLQKENDILDIIREYSALNRENEETAKISALTFDENDRDSARKYFNDLLNIQMDYQNKRQKIEVADTEEDYDMQISQEKYDLSQQQKDLKRQLEDMKDTWQQYYDDGKITKEEYDKDIERIEKDFAYKQETLVTESSSKIAALNEEKQAKINKIESDGAKERSNIMATQSSNYLAILEKEVDKAEEIMNRKSAHNVDRNTGIINYKAEKKNLEDTLKSYENTFFDIAYQKSVLKDRFEKNEITFDDFKKGTDELDDFEKNVKDKAGEIEYALSELAQNAVLSVADAVNGYAGEFQELWGMFDELMNLQYDAEQERLENEADALDEQLDLIEDKYDKQADIVQKYTDKINDIEGELSEARGDRREALIDDLAAQREAQIRELENQKQIEAEKKEVEEKQRQNQKKQDELDKKRRKQEKRTAIIGALISTAQAVANALAVKPFPVGIALSAVAAALGAAQVATIASQQYAKGGLLNGRTHAQGGIPVGNTGIEVEGGEYVVSRKATREFLPLLEWMNNGGRGRNGKYAEGGELNIPDFSLKDTIQDIQMQDSRPIYVSVTEFESVQDNMRQVRSLAGLPR